MLDTQAKLSCPRPLMSNNSITSYFCQGSSKCWTSTLKDEALNVEVHSRFVALRRSQIKRGDASRAGRLTLSLKYLQNTHIW